jgi:hypothetical protein
MSRFDMMDKTTEEVVNSITITEGPVTNMSLAIPKTSRTPYSDATKVRLNIKTLMIQMNERKIRANK